MPADGERLLRPYAVPPDVKVVAVADLAPHLREAVADGTGAYVIVRPGYRTHSRLVDADTVALLEEFREPAPIGEAVARFAAGRGLDPVAVLEEAFPVLQMFTAAYLLVPADSGLMEGTEATYTPGEMAFGYEIVRLVQALADTEVYAARAPGGGAVALKVARPGSPASAEMLRREAEILERLGGEGAPRLLHHSAESGAPALVTEWVFGIPATSRGHELRSAGRAGWRDALHDVAIRVLGAYTALHARGIVHGDVHARNVLVSSDDRAWLLDFGLARIPGAKPPLDHLRRAGFSWHTEPEAAAAFESQGWSPPPSFAGEQFSVASLLYTLLSGAHYAGESVDRAEAMAAVIDQPPLPFTRHGVEAWPPAEEVLRRALAKQPGARFPDLAAFRDAFAAARSPAASRSGAAAAPADHDVLVDEVLARVRGAGTGEVFPAPPQASAQYGGAGLALFLHRLAVVREDAELAAEADRWSLAALVAAADDGFEAPEVGVTAERVGRDSLYHREPGVHAVRFAVSHGRGDLGSARLSAATYQQLLEGSGAHAELAFGSAGVLVGGALIMDVLKASPRLDPGPFKEALASAAERAWAYATAGVGSVLAERHLGVAHGLAGIAYGQLRARMACGLPLPAGLEDGLARLAELAEPAGRGVSWPGTRHHMPGTGTTPDHAPGWCAGTAGHVHLWLAASAAYGQDRFIELAERAAWHTWEQPGAHGHLCCGLAGRGYALVRLYQYGGDPRWVKRARGLAEDAVAWARTELAGGDRPLSLYWGALGPLLLAAELASPELAAMPLFAPEQWPVA